MPSLDKTYHSSSHFSRPIKESDHYKHLSIKEIGNVFSYLQSVAYNFSKDEYPKMNKIIHSYR